MKIVILLIFFLAVSILYVLVKRYKQEERERLEKSKEAIQNIIDKIPKKMKKVMKKANDTFPTGAVKLASTISDCQPGLGKIEDKLIEAFEDIKDIRYGKLGASNSVDGATTNKWIKVSSFTVSGAWDPRGFTLEVYPRIRTVSSSRQTLVCLVRNADKDIEAPYVSLNTHNEAEPNSRFIKDVRVVRTGGSGITSNTVEVWIQMGHPWATTGYVMYYLYNFKTNDFVATVPQAQLDNPPSGQSWGISENIEPQNGKYQIKGTKVKIGDKWTLSGVGDAHLNDDWLRLFGSDEKDYYGGLAAGKLYTPELHIPGKIYSTMNVKGGNIGHESDGHEFRHANLSQGIGLGYNTIYATGYNADQDLGLKARGSGKVIVKGNAVINGNTQHITDDGDANSEQLVIGRTNESNLRLGKTAEYSWTQSHGSKPLKINPVGNEVHIASSGAKTTMNGDVEIKGTLRIGNSVLTSEGASLIVGHADGRRIMRIDPGWDKVQIYKNSNGSPPYFYYNIHNNYGTWG